MLPACELFTEVQSIFIMQPRAALSRAAAPPHLTSFPGQPCKRAPRRDMSESSAVSLCVTPLHPFPLQGWDFTARVIACTRGCLTNDQLGGRQARGRRVFFFFAVVAEPPMLHVSTLLCHSPGLFFYSLLRNPNLTHRSRSSSRGKIDVVTLPRGCGGL